MALAGSTSRPAGSSGASGAELVLCHSLILGCLGSNEVSPQIAIFRGLTSFDPGHPTLNFSCDKALGDAGFLIATGLV